MAVSVMARRASGHVLRSLERSNSCPDLGPTISNVKVNHLGAATGAKRNLNLMVLHPRAPKIRHLNASHSLLIELEENVKKVQDLESTVLELEKQLQWKEIIKKQNVTLEALKSIKKPQQKTIITEEEQNAFRQRLEEAKKKAAQMTLKRDEEEANILRSWHQKRLKVTIDKMMTKIPESEDEVKLLPLPREANHEALLFSDIDTLVDMANYSPEQTTYNEELERLEVLLKERDNLGKLYQEVQLQEDQAMTSLQECNSALISINTMRIKLNANINMTKTMIITMQNQQLQRKNQNLFVFGPNPIFNSAKEFELNYSINNQFVMQMLQELDLSYHLAQQNLRTARDCKRRYRENRTKIMESLQVLQATIDSQSEHLTTFHNSIPVTNKKIKAQENISPLNQVIQSRE